MHYIDIVEMNAAAVVAMQRRENQRAAAILGATIRQAFSGSDCVDADDSASSFLGECRQWTERYGGVGKTSAVDFASVPASTCSEHDEAKLSNAIYMRAFLVPTAGAPAAHVATVLFFNLALALHLDGIRTGSSHSFKSALLVYRQTHGVLETICSFESPRVVPVIAAVYQNIFQIHAEFFELAEARYMLERMVSFFEWKGSLLLGERDFTFFHTNLHLALMEDFCLAPAA